MADAKTKVEHILDQDRVPTWPAMKRALWAVITAEKLNDGHYINAYALTDKLYAAALAAPQPAASDVPHDVVRALESSLDDWAYAFANWRQGQRSTPSCEAPGAADIRICRDLIEGMLACRPSAPSNWTEEALRAENARLRAACQRLDAYWLETFPEGPDGDVSYAKGLGRLADECIDLWRDIRSALSR